MQSSYGETKSGVFERKRQDCGSGIKGHDGRKHGVSDGHSGERQPEPKSKGICNEISTGNASVHFRGSNTTLVAGVKQGPRSREQVGSNGICQVRDLSR